MGTRDSKGVTLIELAVVIAILSVISVLVANLLVKSWEAYELVTDRAEMQKRLRVALNTLSIDIREAVGDPLVYNDPAATPRDVILMVSARDQNGSFILDAAGLPTPQGVTLYALLNTAQGLSQLRKTEAFYATDLAGLTPPFSLVNPAQAGSNLFILDSLGAMATINADTGLINGNPATVSPKVILNDAFACDLTAGAMINCTLSCRKMVRGTRPVTSSFASQITPRN